MNATTSHLTLLTLRAIYFLGSRHYVHHSLLSNLRQVLRDDAGLTLLTRSSNGTLLRVPVGAGGVGGEEEDGLSSGMSTPVVESGRGGGAWPWSSGGGVAGNVKGDVLLPLRSRSGSVPGRRSPVAGTSASGSVGVGGGVGEAKRISSQRYANGAGLVFCWAFCEGSMLFSLVLLGGVLDPKVIQWSWTLSLGLLMALIVFVVPLAESLLFSLSIFRSPTAERPRLLAPRTIIFTAIPFGIYLFLFYRVGQTMQGLLGIEAGAHAFGFFNTTLSRICVPGVFLIASLSGGGAVNTAWETWEWRRREKLAPTTDQHIQFAEQALARARSDLIARREELESVRGQSGAHDGGGLMGMFKGTGGLVSQLQQEVAGLEAMEAQMVIDLSIMRRRKSAHEYGRTLPGALLNVANWLFSFYCIYRVTMSCVNLIFGYTRRLPAPSDGAPAPSTPTDVVTALVARILLSINIEFDIGVLSRLVGLALLGSIIVVNMRAVLAWGSRLFKVTSAGISSGFMLLALAQLMGTYLLTCLISLPPSSPSKLPSDSIAPPDLLSTLPSFQLFTRLFDLVFLVVAGSTLAVRWLGRQLASESGFGGIMRLQVGVWEGDSDRTFV